MENQMDDEELEPEGELRQLSPLQSITREQVVITGGTLATSVIADIVMHFNGTGVFMGLLATYAVARHSKDIAEYLVPGSNATQVVDATSRVLQKIAPTTNIQNDQRVIAKLKRLAGIKDPIQDNEEDENVVEADTSSGDRYADLDTHVDFGPTLRPDINKVLSGRKVLFGVSDAGKSNNVAVIIEELGRFGVPLFLFDTEGEYKSLVNNIYLHNGIHVTREKIKPDQAYHFAQWALKNLKQIVIDLSSYSDSEAAWMMIHSIKGVKDFEEANEVRLPCEIVLEEASVWLPQNSNQSTLTKVQVEDPDGESVDDEGKPKPISLLALLERAFFSVVVRRGRKRGMGFTLATQRPAELNKSAMSASWMILMRQTQPADFKQYKDFGIDAKQALSLKQGEAFVYVAGKTIERHQFRKRRSPHGADTPGLKELRNHQKRAATQPATDWNAAQSAAGDDNDPLAALAYLPDIDPDDRRYGGSIGGLSGVPDSSERARSELNLSDQKESRDSRIAPPENGLNELVGNAGCIPEPFQPRDDDLLLSGVQSGVFLVFYSTPESLSYGNIAKSLEQIKNEKGQGLGKRYARHASYILEQHGLKKGRRT